MALSGQTIVTTAGTAVRLDAQQVNGPVMVKALPANTGSVYLGLDDDATVTATTGLVLAPGDAVVFERIGGSLSVLSLDAAVNGEGVSWMLLNV